MFSKGVPCYNDDDLREGLLSTYYVPGIVGRQWFSLREDESCAPQGSFDNVWRFDCYNRWEVGIAIGL